MLVGFVTVISKLKTGVWNEGFEGPCHGGTGYHNTVTVQDDPVFYVERVTICPDCGDIVVRGMVIIWEALLNSVQE